MTALVSACAASVVAVGSEVMANCPDCGGLFEPPCADQVQCGGCDPEAYPPLDDEPCSCPGCLEGSNDDGE